MSNTPTLLARPGDLAIHPAERLSLADGWRSPSIPTLEAVLTQLLADHIPTEFTDSETAAIVARASELIAADPSWDALNAVECAVEWFGVDELRGRGSS